MESVHGLIRFWHKAYQLADEGRLRNSRNDRLWNGRFRGKSEVEPKFFAVIEFRDVTSEGLLRASSFKGLSIGTGRS
jgi:hypothetical protein